MTFSQKSIALLVFLLLLPFAAFAQQTTGPDASTSAPDNQAEIRQLIQTLRNDQSREELLRGLEQGLNDQTTVTQPPEPAAEPLGIGAFFAEQTQAVAQNAMNSVRAVVDQLARAPAQFSALDGGQIGLLFEGMRELGFAIIVTYAIFYLAKWLTVSLRDRLNERARGAHLGRFALMVLGARALDLACVLVAWTGSYLIMLMFMGEFGTIDLRQTLYLNAFLAVELTKIAVRFFLSPRRPMLRLLKLSDYAASKLSNGAMVIIGILGYGQLLIVPLFAQAREAAAGRAVSGLLALVAIAIAVGMTLRYREKVAAWLLSNPTARPVRADPASAGPFDDGAVGEGAMTQPPVYQPSRFARTFGPRWHWFMLAYLVFLAGVVLARPGDLLSAVLMTTLKIVFVAIIGFAIAGWVGRYSTRGVSLPPHMHTRLPLLEERINAFVPKFLRVLRSFILIFVIAFAINSVGLVNIETWMQSQFGVRATTAIIKVVFVLLVSFSLWLALTSWVDYRVNPEFGTIPTARESTLLTLFRNAATVVLVIMTLMFVLSEIGLDIAPLLASAGVLGLAIGFGAQKLVQDIITGIFIQLENAMNVGDVVQIGATSGSVERLTIRSVSLRSLDGTYHIIPFSSVDMVSNMMKGFSFHVCDLRIGYREQVDDARQALFDAFEELRGNPEYEDGILADLEWSGVTELRENAVMVRARIKTLPGRQWGIGRQYNYLIKRIFDERDIEIPLPQQTLYLGREKNSRSKPVRAAKEVTGEA